MAEIIGDKEVIDPSVYATDELLRDGSSIHIRAIRPQDKPKLRQHFDRLSPESVYFRFLGYKKELTEQELARFTELDFVRHVGLVATLRRGAQEDFIGVGRYVRGDNPSRAEVAFAVLDEYQGRGIGTLLLTHLARIARASGITEFEADVLGENNRMLEVFGKSGFRVHRSSKAGVIHISISTVPTKQSLEASESREWLAAAQSMTRVLRPRSVAVVGASRETSKIGGALLANIRRGGFKGAVYPINPATAEVQGLKSYPSVSAVGKPIDLAVIALPAEAVEKAVDECARAGTQAVVVISAGFAEVSQAGREAERRLTELVRASGMRMVGPNCMGVINTDPAVSLNATFAPTEPLAGNIGMFTQSGALGIAILDYARRLGLGFSTFVSAGNRADVSNNDLLAYWKDDARTGVVVLYLESVGNPRKFARIARAVARQKPIVAVKSGRSAAGTRAASSHSAALANLDVAVEALFAQAGVIRTSTLEEMFDVVAMLSSQPTLRGPRVGVVTNAGGPGILLADACEAHGLTLPPLADQTLEQLRSFLPPRAGFSNPIDMTASASAQDYERAIATVGADPAIDALVAIYIPPMVTRPEQTAVGIANGAGKVPADKPVLTVFLSAAQAPASLGAGPRGRLPCYAFPENAAMALAAAYRFGRWRERPEGKSLSLEPFARDVVRAVIDRVMKDSTQPRWLEPRDLATVLRAAGIEAATAEQTSVADAPLVADQLGYPLVAKAIAPGLIHKSDVGGVIMGLRSAEEVAHATATLAERMRAIGKTLDAVLLQREISGGIEALVGVTTDPTFGPLVVCGLGGVSVEVLKDASFRLHPVTDVDGEEMISGLRAARLLDGYRGAPPADRKALLSVILKVSALVEAVPEMSELDLNPVKVLAPGQGAVVVDGRMRLEPLASRFETAR
jgi:acetyl coenzyme A synthetase (ADP forming)-like protein